MFGLNMLIDGVASFSQSMGPAWRSRTFFVFSYNCGFVDSMPIEIELTPTEGNYIEVIPGSCWIELGSVVISLFLFGMGMCFSVTRTNYIPAFPGICWIESGSARANCIPQIPRGYWNRIQQNWNQTVVFEYIPQIPGLRTTEIQSKQKL